MKKIVPFNDFIKDPSRYWIELIGETIILKREYDSVLNEFSFTDVMSYNGQVYIKPASDDNYWILSTEIRGEKIGVLCDIDTPVTPSPERNISDRLEDIFAEAIKRNAERPQQSQPWPTADWTEEPIRATFD